MDVQLTLLMNPGGRQSSYSNNSTIQRRMISKTKPFIEEAIEKVFSTTKPKTLHIADLGCSSGPNSLLPAAMIINAIHESCRRSGSLCPEFQVFLNDLPVNDFNAIFVETIPSFYKKLKEENGGELGPCFVSGTPGSFYGRLFPSQSLHFVYSANSLHWLSQVPPELEGEMGNLNKGNVALGRTSPPAVFKAYKDQFQRDFTVFLKSRSQEMVSGGCMILSMLARGVADPFAEECYNAWDDLAYAMRELMAEGIVEEAKLDSFNMPFYEPHMDELEDAIKTEGSFKVTRLEVLHEATKFDGNRNSDKIKLSVSCLRAVTEPMLASHFGETMIDKLFEKLEEKISQRGIHKDVFMISLARKSLQKLM